MILAGRLREAGMADAYSLQGGYLGMAHAADAAKRETEPAGDHDI